MRNFTGAAALFATLLTAAPAGAAAPDARYHYKGDAARVIAQFDAECVWVSVEVAGYETFYDDNLGPPSQSESAWVQFVSLDHCTGLEVYATLNLEDVGFAGSLQDASIDVTFDATAQRWVQGPEGWTVEDLGYRTVEISADLVGEGETLAGVGHWISRTGSSFSRTRSSGQWRDAVVDLSVTIDATTLENHDAWGLLERTHSGEISFYDR